MPTHLLLKGTTLEPAGETPEAFTHQLSDVQKAGVTIVEIAENHLSSALLEQVAARRFGLVLTCQVRNSPADFLPDLDMVRGRARAINVRFADAVSEVSNYADLARSVMSQAHDAGVEVCFETTGLVFNQRENIERLLDAIPEMRLTLNAHQIRDLQARSNAASDTQDVLKDFSAALSRTGMLRCVVSHDPVTGTVEEYLAMYSAIWEQAMCEWRKRHAAGSTMVALIRPGDQHAWQIASGAWKSSARPRS